MPKKAKLGRPVVEITIEQVRNAARMALNIRETAAVLGCSVRTLQRRLDQKAYAEAYEDGQELAKADIKRLLFKGAHNGSVKSQMFLANNLLGWSDKISSTVEQNVNFVVEIPAPLPPDQWIETFGNGKPIDVLPSQPALPKLPK
jgi:hypothetical protein